MQEAQGVNYRHAYHAGNYADVLKHALLVRLVRALQRKEKGFLYVDTHAGQGRYDLARTARGDSRDRLPEWPDGIGRLWARADAPPELGDYLGLVRSLDRGRGGAAQAPRFYPGSPRIVRAMARPQDRLELWEREPAECAALRREFSGERRVAVRDLPHGLDLARDVHAVARTASVRRPSVAVIVAALRAAARALPDQGARPG